MKSSVYLANQMLSPASTVSSTRRSHTHRHKYTLIYDATLGVSQSQESISDWLNLEVLSTNEVPIQCFTV